MNLNDLLEQSLEAMRRDLKHIFTEVSNKKLSPASARDLVAYVKLMAEVRTASSKLGELLSEKSEEELKQLAKDLLAKS